jgi:uncharacterized protein YdeI (BOF family)
MKALSIFLASLIVTVGMSVFPAQSYAQDSQAAAPSQDTGQQAAQSFSGKVVKEGDTYVLRDEANNKTYKLDNQEKAGENEGKTVKVNGTLDSTSETIHVSNLEPQS